MELKKSLAANNRLGKVAIPASLVAILTILTSRFINEQTSGATVMVLTVAYVALIHFIVRGYKTSDVFYDDRNMYLKDHREVLTVEFSRIRNIEMTLSNASVMGVKFFQYRIAYLSSENNLTEIRFFKSIYGEEIHEFEKVVKQANPYVKIEHWAAS